MDLIRAAYVNDDQFIALLRASKVKGFKAHKLSGREQLHASMLYCYTDAVVPPRVLVSRDQNFKYFIFN